jgi:phosphatidate cytidylyltransferase
MAMSMGIKDWGDVTGREQGVLDRFDSVIYAAPVFFHFVQFFIISF